MRMIKDLVVKHRVDTYYEQNDVTIRLNRSTERSYKRTTNERMVVSEQNPHTRASRCGGR